MKKTTILFTTNHPDTLGNACRLEMIDFLSSYFNLTIITNKINLIKNRYKNCEIIELKKKKINLPIVSDIAEWKEMASNINNLSNDFVFMFDDTSQVTLWVKKTVFQYVHQYGYRSSSSEKIIKKIIIASIKKIKEHLYIKGLKKSERVFVVSKPIIEILNKRGIKKLTFTPHGINLNKYLNPLITEFHRKFKTLKEQGYFIITYTGWVTENRGYQLMMDLINDIVKKDNKILLVIAGADKNFSTKIEIFSQQNNLKENILNCGIIDNSLIPGILFYSDVCLSFLDDVPAYHISPPQKIVEYFAAGKPVICNKIEPHEWLVQDGKTGFIVDKDPIQVCEKILYLRNNSDIYIEMCNNAIAESRKYDVNVVYGKIIEEMNNI